MEKIVRKELNGYVFSKKFLRAAGHLIIQVTRYHSFRTVQSTAIFSAIFAIA